ncbi:hypothetical protein [Denitrobaculum tricleocarpae]|uniref:Uncharacterized protein n=1 Tax=Denitrobaculum tricleocarpae TaxID=2591009 RepID=A0A545U1J4_9PROT|nr:hypothetical protein [Denitrobaculum tricleocarpae]TQV83335.1 hypothetical protein FKG95_01680 [Denitrobaculum tricleocarpae]
MWQRNTGTAPRSLIAWTTRIRKDLRKEISALHIRELDRAFMATKKGMRYAPVEDRLESKSEWRQKL